MSNFQKYARFQLIIALSTLFLVALLSIIPATSTRYLAGFSILGLLGIGEIYFKRSGRTPIEDERDEQINHKALIFSYTGFWISFVGWGVFVSLFFSNDGAVPMAFIEPVVMAGFCLVTLMYSSMVLILYSRDG